MPWREEMRKVPYIHTFQRNLRKSTLYSLGHPLWTTSAILENLDFYIGVYYVEAPVFPWKNLQVYEVSN